MGLVSPGCVYLPGVPSESNREQEVRAYLLSEIPRVRRLGWPTAKMVMQPRAGSHRVWASPNHISRYSLFAFPYGSFLRRVGRDEGDREVDRKRSSVQHLQTNELLAAGGPSHDALTARTEYL